MDEDQNVPKTYGEKLAKEYSSKLFKEYCICDLTFYKQGK